MDKKTYDQLLAKLTNKYFDAEIDKTTYNEMKKSLELDYERSRFKSGEIDEATYNTLRTKIEEEYGSSTDNKKITGFSEGDMVSNRYRIIRKLGEGGMAIVYLAENIALGKKVAIKKILPTLMTDQSFIDRFTREAQSQASLNHPNIVHVTDFDPESLSLIIEYVEGDTLEHILHKKKRFSEKEALHIIKQTLDALNYAHQRRVIHRDIKPSNIMIDAQNNVKITDFGIALIMGEERKTRTGVGIGTPEYMSPEQILGEKNIDHRTDVYSCGIVLYEMLTGQLPFKADDSTQNSDFAVKNMHISKSPDPLSLINQDIKKSLSGIVLIALSKSPDERYSGCGEFQRVIEKYESGRANISSEKTHKNSHESVISSMVNNQENNKDVDRQNNLIVGDSKVNTGRKKVTGLWWYIEVFKKWYLFDSRSSRSEYWIFTLINLVIFSPIITYSIVTNTGDLFLFGLVYFLIIFLPGLSLNVRRLHDTGRRAWWLILVFIPYINYFTIWIYLIFMLIRGSSDKNRYGLPHDRYRFMPKTGRMKLYVVIILIIVSVYILFDSLQSNPAPIISRAELSKAGERKEITVNGVNFSVVYIPPGEYTMGSPSLEIGRSGDERPHRVTITKGYWMMETEVTQELYEAVMENNPSQFTNSRQNPVENVEWQDAVDFCNKLSHLTGYTFELPTEAEWEYACRAGTTGAYSFGSVFLLPFNAWYNSNAHRTHPVGRKKPNSWGLYDMHGNVWEWCADWYGDYPEGKVTDPKGPSSGQYRVLRGGSWILNAWSCRSANRGRGYPGLRGSIYGFRAVLR